MGFVEGFYVKVRISNIPNQDIKSSAPAHGCCAVTMVIGLFESRLVGTQPRPEERQRCERARGSMTQTQAFHLPLSGQRAPIDYDRAPTYSGMIVEKDVLVPMRDGVKIAIDVYRPDTTDKLPALLAFSIHNKDLQGPDLAEASLTHPAWSMLWTGPAEAGDTRFFVGRGYVHVIGNPRGVAKSEGGGSRAFDSYDLIEWIAGQPWCDGNVGMLGISAFGAQQLMPAHLNPPHLKAIFPFDPRGAYCEAGGF